MHRALDCHALISYRVMHMPHPSLVYLWGHVYAERCLDMMHGGRGEEGSATGREPVHAAPWAQDFTVPRDLSGCRR